MEKERIGIFGQVCVRLKVSNIRGDMDFNYNKKGSFMLPFYYMLSIAFSIRCMVSSLPIISMTSNM